MFQCWINLFCFAKRPVANIWCISSTRTRSTAYTNNYIDLREKLDNRGQCLLTVAAKRHRVGYGHLPRLQCAYSFPKFAMCVALSKDITNYMSCKKKPTLACTMFCSPQGSSDILYKVETGFLFSLQHTTYDRVRMGCPTTLSNPIRNILKIFCHFS